MSRYAADADAAIYVARLAARAEGSPITLWHLLVGLMQTLHSAGGLAMVVEDYDEVIRAVKSAIADPTDETITTSVRSVLDAAGGSARPDVGVLTILQVGCEHAVRGMVDLDETRVRQLWERAQELAATGNVRQRRPRRISRRASKAIIPALHATTRLGHSRTTTAHLLYALLHDEASALVRVLNDIRVDADDLRNRVERRLLDYGAEGPPEEDEDAN